jgi:putative transposase
VSHKSGRYTSEISDGQWQRLKWMLPKQKGAGRPIQLDLREVMNAIFYLLVTGCQWRNLPREYPNPHSVYDHYRKWCLDGTWQRINRAMGDLERRRVRRFARPSAAILDSQSVKVSDTGGISGYDGNKKIKGRKRHILVDTLGNLLEVVVSAANIDDRAGAKALLTKVERQIALRLLKIWADKGYQGDLELWLHQQWAIALEIVSAASGQVGFAVQPRRWVVERTFAWLGKFRRLSKDYERDTLSSEGFIYLASIRTLLKRFVG